MMAAKSLRFDSADPKTNFMDATHAEINSYFHADMSSDIRVTHILNVSSTSTNDACYHMFTSQSLK